MKRCKWSPRSGHNTASNSRATVHVWFAASSIITIGGRSLRDWWEILFTIARRNGGTQRLSGRVYDAISCGMRLMVTVGGRVG